MTSPGPHETSAPTLTVDLSAVRRNYARLRDAAFGAETAAAVKADAYGLGANAVVRALSQAGCKLFFTATAGEALALKPILPEARIVVLNGFPDGGAGFLAGHGLIPALNTVEEAAEWAALPGRPPCVLQFDTGIHRAGIGFAQAGAMQATAARLNLSFVMSHLAAADDPDHALNRVQLERFKAVLAALPPAPASLSASAGILLGKDYAFDIVRPGIGLYGGNPLSSGPSPVAPTVRLTAQVSGVRSIAAGDSAGYGASFTATRPMQLAVCGIGYADGVPRALSNMGIAFAAGHACPYAGRVSMDLLTLDVTGAPNVVRGTEVELIAPHMPLDRFAALAGTNAYEILTGLRGRIRRRYVDGASG